MRLDDPLRPTNGGGRKQLMVDGLPVCAVPHIQWDPQAQQFFVVTCYRRNCATVFKADKLFTFDPLAMAMLLSPEDCLTMHFGWKWEETAPRQEFTAVPGLRNLTLDDLL